MFALSVITTSGGGGAQVISREICTAVEGIGGSSEHVVFNKNENNVVNISKWIEAIRRCKLAIQQSTPKVVMTHLDGSLFAVLGANVKPATWVHVFHGPPTQGGGFRRRIYELIKRLSLNRVDLIVYVSKDQQREHVVSYPFLKNKKSLVIRNPFIPSDITLSLKDLTYLAEARAAGRRILLLPGRLSKQKNQQFLLKLMQYRKESGLRDLLLLAGDGPDKKILSCICNDLNLSYSENLNSSVSSDIIFLGYRVDAQALMRAADAVLLPSLYEGYPLAMVESLCLGTRLIASDCSTGPKEISVDLDNYLVQMGVGKLLTFKLLPCSFTDSDVSLWNAAIENSLAQSDSQSTFQNSQISLFFDRASYHGRWREALMQCERI